MTVAQRIRSLVSAACFIIFNRICCLIIPLHENQVCFLAETHKGLNGNLKAVYNKLRETRPDLELLVFSREDRRDSHSVSSVFRIWKAISVSKYLFLDDLYNATAHMKARKGQEIIQLWHGAGAYKKFGHSRSDLHVMVGGKKKVHQGYKKYTKAIVSGSKIAWCYAEAFSIDESKIIATGTPRMDNLYKPEYVAETKAKFLEEHPQLMGKKLILFAPTYRGTLVREADYGFKEANINELSRQLGDEYVILTRWHTALKNNIKRGIAEIKYCDYGKQIIDFSDYPEVNDLLIACDIMVTDYSSIIFDYFPLGKPIVYYAYDKEEYAGDRGLYYDFGSYVFGDVAESFKELVDAIKAANIHEEARERFGDLFLDSCDENSTERVCKLI